MTAGGTSLVSGEPAHGPVPYCGEWTQTPSGARVHRLACVAPWVQLGEGVVIHPFAVVGRLPDQSAALARKPTAAEWLEIEGGSVIGPHAIVYGGTRIGAGCLIGDHASVREGCDIGPGCIIGRHVTVNYNVCMDRAVRLQDFTHITGNCSIGAESFFGVGIVTSNDRRVDLDDYHFPGANPPHFGSRVMVGSGANVLAGVRIGDGALIGAGALVVKDVPAGGRALGKPAEISATVVSPRRSPQAAVEWNPV